MRKGQTAMEYLMTYGWVIIIILVVVALLWSYGVFTPGVFTKPQAVGFSSFYISDWKLATDGTLTVYLSNQIDHDVNITKIYVDGVEKSVSPSPPVTVESGTYETISVTTGKTGSVGSEYKISVTIEFLDVITSIPHNDTGNIIGKFE